MSDTPIFDATIQTIQEIKLVGDFQGRRAERTALADDLRRILAGRSLRKDLELYLERLDNGKTPR